MFGIREQPPGTERKKGYAALVTRNRSSGTRKVCPVRSWPFSKSVPGSNRKHIPTENSGTWRRSCPVSRVPSNACCRRTFSRWLDFLLTSHPFGSIPPALSNRVAHCSQFVGEQEVHLLHFFFNDTYLLLVISSPRKHAGRRESSKFLSPILQNNIPLYWGKVKPRENTNLHKQNSQTGTNKSTEF